MKKNVALCAHSQFFWIDYTQTRDRVTKVFGYDFTRGEIDLKSTFSKATTQFDITNM